MTSIWLVASVWTGLAQGHPVAQPVGEYAPEGGRFSIRFPGNPKATTQTTKSELAAEVKVHIATYATSDGNVYMVSYSDLPDQATKEENLESLFKGVTEGATGGKEVPVKETKVKFGPDKLPARYLDFDRGKEHVKLRVVLDGSRLYQVAVVGSSKFCNGKDADKFLESFEIAK